jgi:predicted transposase/invertase (TIGR01784 family)
MSDDTKERYINPYTDFGFKKLFEQAEIAKYSDLERRQYEESKKVFWDNYSVMKTARDKGIQEGIQQGLQQGIHQEKAETVQRMKAKGFSVEDISEIAGLTIEEIKNLLQ